MAKRIPLNRKSTRKRAEVGDGKPPENQSDHAASGAEALDDTQLDGATVTDEKISEDRRAYEVKFGAETEFVILPGENPLEFEMLHARLVEELSPDGPLEEDVVFSVAKGRWRKERVQRFFAARVVTAQFDHRHEPIDDATFLNAFSILIEDAAEEDAGDFREIRRRLDQLGGPFADFADHLEAKCPRREFRTNWDWIRAMQTEFQKSLPPAATRVGDRPDGLLVTHWSAVLTDHVFARELEFEERIDRMIERALTRLEKIKKSKQQTSFREAQRLRRARRGVFIRLVK